MVNTLITYDEKLTVIGTLPTMAPRPNATNIHAVNGHLYERLSTITSFKSTTFGYAGTTKKAELYALDTNTPWADFANPGPVQEGTDGSLDAGAQRDQQAIYYGRVSIYISQSKVKSAIITVINECVPKKYKRVDGGIGAMTNKVNLCPRTILDHLPNLYGRPTPNEKTHNKTMWAAPYHPSDPIKDIFDCIEECFVVALVAKPAYSTEQKVDKTLINIQLTSLYSTSILEWNAIDEVNKTWPEFKVQFTEAYDIRIRSGAGTAGTMGYHGAKNTEGSEDGSWAFINKGLMAQLQQVQLANNTSAQATNDSVSALTVEIRELCAALLQTQQQLAMFTRSPACALPATPPTWPHVQAPPHSHITPPPPACTPIPYAPTS